MKKESRIHIRVPKELQEAIQAECRLSYLSVSEFIRQTLRKACEDLKRNREEA